LTSVFALIEPLAAARSRAISRLAALVAVLAFLTAYPMAMLVYGSLHTTLLSDEIAVMHEGRVLQVGPPETIYTRPVNRTVAAFDGTPNLLPAKVQEERWAPDATLARVQGEGWDCWCSAPG
jgi:iron(III) transport system ATP-binding protein